MIYGPFSLTDATEAELHFNAWIKTQAPSAMNDYLCLMVSTNWTAFYGECAWGNSAGWYNQTLDLENIPDYSDMTGKSQVWLRFYLHSDASIVYAGGAYVDDILLRKCVGGNCAAATSKVSEPDRFGWYTFPAVKSLEQP